MASDEPVKFRDRADAALQLAQRFKGRNLRDPIVLAIPRGGVMTGAVLAHELGAEFDVVLSRKLRAPAKPELAVGAVSEDGTVYFNPRVREYTYLPDGYIESERRHQLAETARRKQLIRNAVAPARLEGRSVIVTDDGIATGASLIAALQTVRGQKPYELIAAAPVASPDRLEEVHRWCDDVVCLAHPEDFQAIGQFYEHFEPVEDSQVLRLLCESIPDDAEGCAVEE